MHILRCKVKKVLSSHTKSSIIKIRAPPSFSVAIPLSAYKWKIWSKDATPKRASEGLTVGWRQWNRQTRLETTECFWICSIWGQVDAKDPACRKLLITAKNYTSCLARCYFSRERVWQIVYFLSDSKRFRLLVQHKVLLLTQVIKDDAVSVG